MIKLVMDIIFNLKVSVPKCLVSFIAKSRLIFPQQRLAGLKIDESNC